MNRFWFYFFSTSPTILDPSGTFWGGEGENIQERLRNIFPKCFINSRHFFWIFVIQHLSFLKLNYNYEKYFLKPLINWLNTTQHIAAYIGNDLEISYRSKIVL
jgi:hypothetical protein